MSAGTTIRPDLARLDQITQSHASAGTDDGVLELVERVADAPGGLDDLIDRYLEAPNPILPRAIAFVLAKRAEAPSAETWRLTLELTGRLQGSSDPSTLINGLTAIQRQISFRSPRTSAAALRTSLSEFLLHCLEQTSLVQSTTIDLLTLFAEDRLLTRVFAGPDAARLRRKLTELAAGSDTDRREELDQLIASLSGQ